MDGGGEGRGRENVKTILRMVYENFSPSKFGYNGVDTYTFRIVLIVGNLRLGDGMRLVESTLHKCR